MKCKQICVYSKAEQCSIYLETYSQIVQKECNVFKVDIFLALTSQTCVFDFDREITKSATKSYHMIFFYTLIHFCTLP